MRKILSWNIHGSGSKYASWFRRREMVWAVLESTGADLVALQAVYSDPQIEGGVDQARQLARRFPKFQHVEFAPTTFQAGGTANGSALLSRLPLESIFRVPLAHQPGIEDPFDRVILGATLDLEGPLCLLCVHYSWIESQACENVRQTLAWLGSTSQPTLLVGDMNQVPESPAMQLLARAGWHDLWARLHADQAGWTFEVGHLSRRIDYAWANDALCERVRQIELVGDLAEGELRPSDHLGLLVTFETDPKTLGNPLLSEAGQPAVEVLG